MNTYESMTLAAALDLEGMSEDGMQTLSDEYLMLVLGGSSFGPSPTFDPGSTFDPSPISIEPISLPTFPDSTVLNSLPIVFEPAISHAGRSFDDIDAPDLLWRR